jgi:3-isopropylmalate/(R)-2-methylmalate dehydratase small subunit
LLLIVQREAVEAYKPGDQINIDFSKGVIAIEATDYYFEPLPDKLQKIINSRGLVNYMKTT